MIEVRGMSYALCVCLVRMGVNMGVAMDVVKIRTVRNACKTISYLSKLRKMRHSGESMAGY